MGKITDLFKKIRDSKGSFHAKMGSINDRNGRDLTEAEEIKKRWKIIEWERLEISPRKLEIPKKHFMQNGHNKEMACT